MDNLTLPADFALPNLITELAHGDTMFDGDVDGYLQLGLAARKFIDIAMMGAAAPTRILDLTCGFGRVTRFLRACYPTAAITVGDVDPTAVDFSANAFMARRAHLTHNFRDLQLGGPFDLIWGGGLLTQFPEHQTRQFFDFVVRHMATDSRLIVTSHGEYTASQLRVSRHSLSDSAARGLIVDYLHKGYGYRDYGSDPHRGIALVARAWYEALLDCSSLRLRAFYEHGWDRHQDVLVLQKVQPGRNQRESSSKALFDQPLHSSAISADEQALKDDQGVCRFDEDWYCKTYADVALAVRNGTIDSGLAHYLWHGWLEGRSPFDPADSFAKRTDPAPGAWLNGVVGGTNRVEATWSVSPEETAEDVGWYWMAHPNVRARSNVMASGDPHQDAYDRFATLLQERGWTLPIDRSVSIGCGFGGLERDLTARNLIREIDAYDIAASAVAAAERQAHDLGFHNIHYHIGNLEELQLPPHSLDVAFAHSSVHHVEKLEALYSVLQRALRPGGVLHLHEYIGPTRFQWTDAQLELANAFLDSLPPRLRRQPNGALKDRLRRPTIEEMIAADPSEAVRSADLVGALGAYFDIIEYRPLGGALAHIALGGIAQNFVPDAPDDEAFLQRLFAMEDEAMAEGVIASDFATITAIARPLVSLGCYTKQKNGSAVTSSLTARLASVFPPIRRLHDSITFLNRTVSALQASQDRMADELNSLRSHQQKVTQTASPATQDADAPAVTRDVEADLDRAARRELGEAALRNLPFLPGEFHLTDECLTVVGYCGAPEGLTQNMAFFANGQKIDDVEYPILDPELKSRFPDVPGMGFVFRAHVREGLQKLRAERFWRFDAAPTGHYTPADWRRAIHYMNPGQEHFAFPPVENIKRVIGDTSVERFAMGGAIIFNNAANYLREIGKSWHDFPSILDWGCGAGRLTRYLIGETPSRVTGVDIDADNIAWCQKTYAGGSFKVVPLRPPSDLEEESFDLVFGLSVLTHLQEQDQFLWLKELQRITRPGALLLLSVQGPTQFSYNKFPPHLYRKLQADGYIDLSRDAALDAVVTDKEYYRAAMHSRAYIVKRWGEFFEVLSIVDAIAGLQDFVVLRRR